MKQRLSALAAALAAALCLAACGGTASPEPPALEDVKTGYTAAEAEKDGCVVMDGMELLAGEELWCDFVNRSAAGCESTVRIYQGYSDQDGVYFVKELRFDGERYLLRYYDRDGTTGEEFLAEGEYAFLTRCLYSPRADGEGLTEGWLLADSSDADHEGYFNRLLSSSLPTEEEAALYGHCHAILSRGVDDGLLETFYGTAYADIDGDGKTEKCRLGMGRTSGLFTFTLTVSRNGRTVSENTYCSEWYDLSFLKDADGTLRVQGITQDDPPVTRYFTLRVEGGGITLVPEDGGALRPIGLGG